MIHRYRKKIKLKLRKNNCLFSYYLVPLVKGLLFRIGKVKLQRESNPEVKAVKSERERERKRERGVLQANVENQTWIISKTVRNT